jgi:hypothetical protein
MRMKHACVRALVTVLGIALLSGISGCATVSPLKRKNLSDPVMQQPYDEQEKSLNDHIFERREGSSGGSSGSGGGCGC